MSWVHDYFRSVDSMNMDAYLAFLSEDVRFRLGNNPPISGIPAVKDRLTTFWSQLKGLRHNIVNLWELDDVTIVESTVTYTRLDDREVTLPVATTMRRHGDKVSDIRIYIDLAPLFA